MQITFEKTAGGHGQALLAGELTIFHAIAMKQQLLALLAEVDELDLDLSTVEEIDTAGLQVLMLAKTEALAQQKQLKLSAHSQVVVDLLDLSKLSSFFGDPVLLPSNTDNRSTDNKTADNKTPNSKIPDNKTRKQL